MDRHPANNPPADQILAADPPVPEPTVVSPAPADTIPEMESNAPTDASVDNIPDAGLNNVANTTHGPDAMRHYEPSVRDPVI